METPVTSLLKAALWAYAVGGCVGLCFLRRERAANGFAFSAAAVAGALGLTASILFLSSGASAETVRFAVLPSLVPYVRFSINLDPLSAFFLLIVSTLALALSIYSLGYARGFYGRKSVGVLAAFFNL